MKDPIMHTTFNDLPLDIRERVIKTLNARLADTVDLYSQIKQAHWTIRDPNFIALHELFDEVGVHVLDAADLIAERIGQLGGEARGTVRVAAKNSTLPEYPLESVSAPDHVLALSKALSHTARLMRQDIETTDAVTADMLTQIMRNMDKDLWFIENHLPHLPK